MPVFTMMCGLPGSGKSDYAQKIAKETGATVFSSDAIRLELFGTENEQRHQDIVFETLHRRVKEALRNGKDAVYDATNINYKRRMAFVGELANIPCEKVCVLIATSYTECLRRNASRERIVPENVVKRMLMSFWIPQFYEGWDKIIVERTERHDLHKLFNVGNDDSPLPLNQFEQDNPHHDLTVGHHCLACAAYLETHYPDSSHALLQAALLHDIGKPFTKTFTNKRGIVTEIAHYYDHHNVSAYMSLFYTSPEIEDILQIANYIQWHMRPFEIEKSDNRTKSANKFSHLIGGEIYWDIMRLHEADVAAKGKPKDDTY